MFKESMDSIVSHLESLISTKTIFGEPVVAGNITMIPIMSASFGFGAGAGEGEDKKNGGKGTGGGGGASVTPKALVIIQDGVPSVYSLGKKGTIEKLAEVIPEAIAKFCPEKSRQEEK